MKITCVTWRGRDDGTPRGPNGVPSPFAWRRVTVSVDKPRRGFDISFMPNQARQLQGAA